MDWINGFLNATKFIVGDSPVGIGLNYILGFIKNFLSTILSSTIIPLLNNVMSYQNFFSDGVNAGWTITRDFSNLFFALVLLLIAISTVLNIGALDKYTAKRMLPNFIFVALFINFSKAIVGFLIDISQIIMISFYNSFGPNLANMIGNASRIAEAGAETNTDNLAINLFTIVLLAILIFVLLWTALILAVRIVTLWFVIMLSPLAFISYLIPSLGSINSDWNKKLQESLITGPTLMFLLYLAFAVMNAGISSNPSGGNLMTNGNLLSYVLVVGLLFLANSQAMQAAQSAPPMLKNAVGVAGTLATFGIGAKVGAGGYGTRQMFKKGVELGDKGIGGATRTIQAGSLGKVKLNSRYEAFKKDMVDRNDAGIGLFGGLGQQFSKAGQEEQQKDFDKARANELYSLGKLEDKANERYKKIFDSNQATAASDIKGVENLDKLIDDLDDALKDGDKAMAMALSSRISELKGWSKVFSENGKDRFSQYGKIESEGEQLTAFIADNFGKDKSGKEITNNKILSDFKSRQVSILKSKGADNFTVGLTPETMSSPSKKAIDAGILGAGAMFAKNNQIFNVRDYETDTEGNKVYLYDDKGLPSYYLDTSKFLDLIKNETSIDLLKDPKSWAPFGNKNKNDIKESVNKELEKSDIPDDARKKLEASLLGLGKSSENTPKRPAGFRTD